MLDIFWGKYFLKCRQQEICIKYRLEFEDSQLKFVQIISNRSWIKLLCDADVEWRATFVKILNHELFHPDMFMCSL